jgi:hypothetical protein
VQSVDLGEERARVVARLGRAGREGEQEREAREDEP